MSESAESQSQEMENASPEVEEKKIDLAVLDPAALRQLIAGFDQIYGVIDESVSFKKEEISDLFNYINGVVILNEWEKGARILREMKPVIDTYFIRARDEEEETAPDIDDALDFLVEWHMLSLRFTPETKSDFADILHYRELLDAFEQAPKKFRVNEIRAKLQMVHHYNHWVARGGDVEVLSDEDYDILENLSQNYLEELDELLAEKVSNDAWAEVIQVKRTLHKYYTYRGQPNDAIKTLKELIELSPKQEDYTLADSADLQMELAKVYVNYRKWKTARKYFLLAQKNYEQEDLEMFTMQAESWVEECDKMLSL